MKILLTTFVLWTLAPTTIAAADGVEETAKLMDYSRAQISCAVYADYSGDLAFKTKEEAKSASVWHENEAFVAAAEFVERLTKYGEHGTPTFTLDGGRYCDAWTCYNDLKHIEAITVFSWKIQAVDAVMKVDIDCPKQGLFDCSGQTSYDTWAGVAATLYKGSNCSLLRN